VIDLGIVDELLGAPAGAPQWQVADLANRAGILPTWLSSVVARGGRVSPSAAEYLARAERRVAALHRVGDELVGRYGVTVIKGARIAARMPAGLLRRSGDTDVVAGDQETLWRCVLDLRRRYGATPQSVNLLQADDSLHVVVAMKWPAEEPELDKPMGADVATCAFWGNLTDVGVRMELPSDEDVRSLFAVAEERFQRSFSRKDMLDLAVLADTLDARLGDRLVPTVLDAAERLNLAPELRRLVRKTGAWVDLPDRWLGLSTSLKPPASTETRRRRGAVGPPHRLRFGCPLDEKPSDGLAVQLPSEQGPALIDTPIGTCLLVDDPNIPADLLAAATEQARLVSSS
jgi:hypothetical protein